MSPYEIHLELFLRERSIATMTDYHGNYRHNNWMWQK